MVYDRTAKAAQGDVIDDGVIRPGYAIHDADEPELPEACEVYTDDGRGNGDYVCRAVDSYWAGRIARALDSGVR